LEGLSNREGKKGKDGNARLKEKKRKKEEDTAMTWKGFISNLSLEPPPFPLRLPLQYFSSSLPASISQGNGTT
jgi:hypothetical protein